MPRKRGQHVEVYEGRDGWFRFRLVAGNGEKQAASQAYKAHRHGVPNEIDSRVSAVRGARAAHPGLDIEVIRPGKVTA